MITKSGIEALSDSESFATLKLLFEMGRKENKTNNKNNSRAAKIWVQIYFILNPYLLFGFCSRLCYSCFYFFF